MNVNVNVDLFATHTVETDQPAIRRDSRDWRNVSSDDRPKRRDRRTPRRQSTRQAVLQAHAREGGF